MRLLEGPNVYLHRPVLAMKLDLEDLTGRESHQFPGFVDSLLEQLPGIATHYCGLGRSGGFVERLRGGTYFGHIVEHVVLELEHRLGYEVRYGRTRVSSAPNLYDVVMEMESKYVAPLLVPIAIHLIESLLEKRAFDVAGELSRVQKIQAEVDLGPSTRAIVEAARRRQIPVRRIGQRSLVQLGTGKYRKLIQATLTSQTSAIGVDIASDKELTKLLLQGVGMRVPKGGTASSYAAAHALFHELQRPVVVKPINGCQGQGITLELDDETHLRAAYEFARTVSQQVVMEEQVEGKQYRLLIVNGRFVAASERVPAHVVGDGEHTVQELVDAANRDPKRGDDHEKPLTKIPVDEFVLRFLARKNRTLDQIPAAGEVVMLRDSANLSTGGTAIDVTARTHSVHAHAAEKAAAVVGLDVCGVDMIVRDIGNGTDPATIIEVNAAPGIRMHHYPSFGEPQAAGDAIIEALFPLGSTTHVPIVSITGTNGKTTTTRLLRHILQKVYKVVGMTTTDGVYVGADLVWAGDASGPKSAHMVLSDPAVDVAVLETARGGIQREGLGYEWADVAVLTNITGDHIGQDGLATVQDIAHVKSLVAERVRDSGVIVLNADDAELVKLAPRFKVRIVWIGTDENSPVIKKHLAAGGQAFFQHNGWLVEGAGALLWPIAKIDEIPLTIQGTAHFHVANLLCAIAAARQLGVSRSACRTAVGSFQPFAHNPGRVQMYELPSGLKVILDYGHNEDGMKAIGEMVQRWSRSMTPAVIGYPGDRDDKVIAAAARMAARYFSPLVIKEDADLRGRQPGEVANLIECAVVSVRKETSVVQVLNERKALAYALDNFDHAGVLVAFFEKLQPLVDLIEQRGGREVDLSQVQQELIQVR